ncbi:MAG TPA: branched-chain amino acid transaminase [Candidatus Babeliales bacterium]|jgi:branched-chain amino acid aminotransferase|nr:branched-chain amino acid transaminase [Candidatus Babeliales bacterium]
MKKSYIWLDGTIVPSELATISVMTHTLHYGTGAFEGIRCYATPKGPAIFRLSDHVERLLQSFSCFGVACPYSKNIIEQAIVDTIRINNARDCYIRPIIFFGSESLLLSPKNLSVHCAIIIINMDKYLGKEAIKVGISSVKRISPESMPVHNKINGYYVNSIFAYHEVKNRGFDEALLLDHDGNISEGSVANIFFVIDGKLKTPDIKSILPGITRASIIAIASKLGIEVCEQSLTIYDINKATEAFFTGTASEITPIKSIDNKKFSHSPGCITQKIQMIYHSVTNGTDTDFASWLYFI